VDAKRSTVLVFVGFAGRQCVPLSNALAVYGGIIEYSINYSGIRL
jgi:hypothetical protein